MRFRCSAGIVFSVFLLVACAEGPVLSSYSPVLPELPALWKEMLGEAHWRLEWVNGEGLWEERVISPGGESPALAPIGEWTSPVLASPFWPARALFPGMMRPAGALFPWDASGEKIALSWEGGADAFFWKEMALAARAGDVDTERFPWLFDWPRFRKLARGETVAEALRLDPWLADWREIARKTVQSGFSRRLIAPKGFTELTLSGMDGIWAGSSPFQLPFEAPPGGLLRLNVSPVPDTWVSARGILKCSASGWVFRPADSP